MEEAYASTFPKMVFDFLNITPAAISLRAVRNEGKRVPCHHRLFDGYHRLFDGLIAAHLHRRAEVYTALAEDTLHRGACLSLIPG